MPSYRKVRMLVHVIYALARILISHLANNVIKRL